MSEPSGHRPYRLGLDLGSNSLGWWIVWLGREREADPWKPVGIGPGGVRIFDDGRGPPPLKTSNATGRRDAKGARARRDRYVRRRQDVMAALIRHGLMPADEADRKALENLDPYWLRAEALDGPLPLHQIGRALLHMNQRRGFQSNRKAEKAKENNGDAEKEKGAIKEGEQKLERALESAGARTLGAFLWSLRSSEAARGRRSAIDAELARLGKTHLTGNARKKASAKARKRLFPDTEALEGAGEVRARPRINGSKLSYEFYPSRKMLRDEFEAIWTKQSEYYPEMTVDARKEIEDGLKPKSGIFYQRQLKEPVVGKCSLSPATDKIEMDPEGYRAPLAHPLAQRFRILQEVRNLRVLVTGETPRDLRHEEAERVLASFVGAKEVTFKKLRTLLKLPAEARFNLEDGKREKLLGDQTAARLADVKRFGKSWYGLPVERQIEIVERLLRENDSKTMIDWLVDNCGLEADPAARVADAVLPEGHSRFGLRVIKELLPLMASGKSYSDAAKAAGYDHAKPPTGEILDRLPYYGAWAQDEVVGSGEPLHKNEKRFGRFPNPTVHVGLNQLRWVVNALIKQHGAPTQIVIEFTRDLKLSKSKKDEELKKQKKNQDLNDAIKQEIKDKIPGYEPGRTDVVKVRLWKELGGNDVVGRQCVYTGKTIGFRQLMSSEVDIDHLIPFATSLDDSFANKIVCFTQANRAKGKNTPYLAFGHSPPGYDWEAISARANSLPGNKRWRFEPNAHQRYDEFGDGDERGFLARQIRETGWLARFAKRYLGAVTNPYAVRVVPGRMTAMVRARWGLNGLLPSDNYDGVTERNPAFNAAMGDMEFSGVKNRADHRHHAIDAFVMAMTDFGLMQQIASANADERERIKIPKPDHIEGWWDAVKTEVNRIIVSHKPDHGVGGKLHEDTAYGLVRPRPDLPADKQEKENLVYRKPLEGLNEKEIGRIRDLKLRKKIHDRWSAAKGGTTLQAVLQAFAVECGEGKIPGLVNGLSRVRILKSEKPDYLVAVSDNKTGAPYKAYSAGENFCVEIFETGDGAWRGEAVRRFDANRPDHRVRWRDEHPDATLVMRIAKGDLIRLEHDGQRRVMVVHRLDASANRFKLAEHNETGNLDRRHATSIEIDPFRWLMASYGTLKKLGAERVRVDELGEVRPVKRTRSVVGGVAGVDERGRPWRATDQGDVSS